MSYRHVFDKISTEFRGIFRVFVNFAGFRGFSWISWLRDRAKYQKPCISKHANVINGLLGMVSLLNITFSTTFKKQNSVVNKEHTYTCTETRFCHNSKIPVLMHFLLVQKEQNLPCLNKKIYLSRFYSSMENYTFFKGSKYPFQQKKIII